ncbi:MAG: S-adenosylmethionine:tRNA ribosyltransferase-isomerase, partial [Chloroflexi bacterium]|nr:S-adenosylmethionine:tRNA ribosyltransferase-isomerase [Chloroflexota bacterium]
DLVSFLDPGDLLVVNTSGTMRAALKAERMDGTPLELHLSTHLPGGEWTVELRSTGVASGPFLGAAVGETLRLAEGASVTLRTPYRRSDPGASDAPTRVWAAGLRLPSALDEYLTRNGFAVHYSYVKQDWPIEYYQTVYATEVGSAEMPSAGRPFTHEMITRLVSRGIGVVPLLLHTGVASLEKDEPPYDEFYRVPLETARAVNAARAAGKRVVAVGTTVVRALETVTDVEGNVQAGEGWTNLVVTPWRGVRSVNALLTGLHEPRATHLALLAALAGRDHLRLAYAQALQERYLWHEFGDSHLILTR